ncbi:MAG: hypothetical protein ACKOWL_07130 [Sphingobacteriaceae bacterium]
MSRPYAYQSNITIQFTNSISTTSNRTDTFSVKVLGSGWEYIFHGLKPIPALKLKISTVQADIKLDSQLDSLNKQLGEKLRILSIWPNKITFATKNVGTKVVPVLLRHILNFEHFYGLCDTIRLQPNRVTLSGSAEKLNEIKAIYTEVLEQKDVNTSIKQWVNLENKYTDVGMYPKQVLATVPVSSFTEKELTLPIRIKNNTAQLQLALLPAKVQAHILVALTNYEKISATDFEAYIDLTNWDPQKKGTLPIKFGKIPHFVRFIRTEPQTVDLLIYP